LRGKSVGTTTIVCFECGDEPSALEPSEHLVQGARGEVNARKLLDVLDEGVAELVAPREAGEHEHGSAGVSP
jgi:hypothetical protein